jgi:uncharacterized protein
MKLSRRFFALLLGGLLLLAAPLVLAAADLPERPLGPSGEAWYVLDEGSVLSDSTEAALQSQLATLAAETSTGMVVVTISTLSDYPIEMYALELGRAWGVGQEEFDNGLVFLVAVDDQEVRIEVGYGLEGAITDAQSSMIINRVAIPYFKEGNYDQGTLETMAALETLARGEAFDIAELEPEEEPLSSDFIFNFLFFLLPLCFGLFEWMSNSKSWWAGGVVGGAIGLFAGGLWGFGIGGAIGLIIDFILSRFFFGKFKGPGGGFWFGGGRGGFGGGRGGISGFGGGSFGGGGASGRW